MKCKAADRGSGSNVKIDFIKIIETHNDEDQEWKRQFCFDFEKQMRNTRGEKRRLSYCSFKNYKITLNFKLNK